MLAAPERLILDSCVALAFFFADEDCRYSDSVMALLQDGLPFLVPPVFPFEIGNSLWVGATKRNRCTPEHAADYLESVLSLNVRIGEINGRTSLMSCYRLAYKHDLAVYDASYLWLALEKRLALATRDEALRQAAIREGVFFELTDK